MKSILVTGAGNGLGKAVAELFAVRGYFVVATDFDESSLSGFAQNTRYLTITMDVTRPASVEKAYSAIRDKNISIHHVINCAGIHQFFPLSEADIDRFKYIFDVNMFGAALVIQRFLDMLIQNKGRIINISSESIKFPGLFQPYQITKIALEAYTKSIRQELMLKGIHVILIRSGAIKTRLMESVKTIRNPVDKSLFDKEFQEFSHAVQRFIPRATTPERVAMKVYKAATSKHPKFIYTINTIYSITFLSWLPERLINYFIKRKFRVK